MKIFISHITQEAPLALVLKDWIEAAYPQQCCVFASSDIEDIPGGTRWLAEIEKALDASSVFVVLCSPASIARPWINFESGCAWIKKIPILPVCHSGLKKDRLPSPLSVFQALDLSADSFPAAFFYSLNRHTKIKEQPQVDRSAMRAGIARALGVVEGG